jgi:hypothetical protein
LGAAFEPAFAAFTFDAGLAAGLAAFEAGVALMLDAAAGAAADGAALAARSNALAARDIKRKAGPVPGYRFIRLVIHLPRARLQGHFAAIWLEKRKKPQFAAIFNTTTRKGPGRILGDAGLSSASPTRYQCG